MSVCVLRIAGTANLEPGKPRTPLAQRVMDAVMAVPGVVQVGVEARRGAPECEITVYWEDGVDSTRAVRDALAAVREEIPGAVFRGASWLRGPGGVK